ncbi:hypothetical protein [Streptomyces sp. NPDC093260]
MDGLRVAAVDPRLVIAESADKRTVDPGGVDGIVEEVLPPLAPVRA